MDDQPKKGNLTMETQRQRRRYRAAALTASLALGAAGLVPAAARAATPAPQPAVSAAAVTPAAAPAGPLTPRGCTAGAGTASCELYAAAGTTTVGGTVLPVWSFTSAADSTPVNPVGPVLVVRQGDAVTLTVHNGLPAAAGALALSLPAMTGLAPDQTGAPAGQSATYQFTAERAGTYLYEAGGTPNGSRQAQMGLVGALVVLDAAATPTAYGTAYDDEAVLVLSEIDPAFNANPIGFDLRNFAPRFRLINGKSFPETDPIGTDQGRTVLLRYLNAGASAHWLSLLNADQTVLANDAHALPYPTSEVTATVNSGETVDAVVRIPGTDASPEARYTLFEPAQHLDTAGANVAGSTTVGFGGMMTYLDTNLPPVTGDTVGPAVSNVRFSQNPVASGPVTVTADASDARSGGSAIDRIEYVVDDPTTTVCTGTPFSSPQLPSPAVACDPASHGSAVTVSGAEGQLDITALGLASGKHKVYVRALDAAGNWGPIGSAVLNVAKDGPATTGLTATPAATNGAAVTIEATGDDSAAGGSVVRAEYLLDPDPANLPPAGSGPWQPMTLNRTATVVSERATLDLSGLAEGRHLVLVHSLNSLGVWGPVQSTDPSLPASAANRALYLNLDRTGPQVTITSLDTSPNNGRLGSQLDPTSVMLTATATDPVAGGTSSRLVDAEGFIDTAGPDGSGFPMTPTSGSFGGRDTADLYGLVPLSELLALRDGTHRLLVHARDGAGNWGPLTAAPLVIDRTGPTVTGLSAAPGADPRFLQLTGDAADPQLPDGTPGSALVAAEWFLDSDPGAGAGTPVSPLPAGSSGQLSATVDLRGITSGEHTFGMRAQDAAGNWGPPATITVTVTQPAEVWSDGFDAALAWTGGQAGAVRTAPAPAGMTGGVLAVAPRLGAPAYVADNNPTADRTYTASVLLDPATLVTGGSAVDLLDGRGGRSQRLFSVQLRTARVGAKLVRQLRVGSLKGKTTAFSGWVTVPATTSAVTLRWAATTGSVSLTAGGRTVGAKGAGNQPGLESVLLGGSAGLTKATTGTAYFDSFRATRR